MVSIVEALILSFALKAVAGFLAIGILDVHWFRSHNMTTDPALDRLRIVLVEPAGALNVGSIARVMKNMGLQQLVLVNPQCDPRSDEARKMAVHAIDVLEAAAQVNTLPEALRGCQRAIATTARTRVLDTPLETPRAALPWLVTDDATVESALIFGREDRGLSNEELNYAQRFVRIPSSPLYPSLNLAQSVAICCYELYQELQGGRSEVPPEVRELHFPTQETVALDALEAYFQQMEAVLLKIGYLYPHTAESRMEKFRQLFKRAHLSPTEVSMLRGIFSQMEWVLQSSAIGSTESAETAKPQNSNKH